VTSPRLVLTTPDQLSQESLVRLGVQLDEWRSGQLSTIVLGGGMRLSVVGGLHVRVRLLKGPLSYIEFDIEVPSLLDLPPRLEYTGGAYVPWIADDGGMMHTTDGGPCYAWEPNP